MRADAAAKREIIIFQNVSSLSVDAAYRFLAHYTQAILNNTSFRVALTGGTGAVELYRILAEESFSKLIDWNRVHIYFSDERCIPYAFGDERFVTFMSENSNFMLAETTLLSKIPIPLRNIHQIFTEMYNPEAAADMYEVELRASFEIHPNTIPEFDLILLGMGPDGHCASLFPHKPSLKIMDRLVVASDPGLAPFVDRVTLTFPVLNNAKNVLFLVHGAQKAEMVKMVLEGAKNPELLPSQSVLPIHGSVTWMLDRSAASQLTF